MGRSYELVNIKHTVDLEAVSVKLAKRFSEELKLFEFSPFKAYNFIEEARMPDSNTFIILMTTEEGEVVGALGGVVTDTVFSFDRIALEVGWYVEPEHRGSLTALRMVRSFEHWARSRGATMVVMVSQLSSTTDPSKVYETMGYGLAEKSYMKRL
jgi:GNAT superfamily N-acetyltransferase